MKFAQVIGHNDVKKRLIHSAKENRVSHALLFLGPEGTGGLPMAVAFAQYLVCENPGDDDSCGTCSACIKMEKYVHPDVSFSFPVATKDKIKEPKSVDFIEQFRKAILAEPYLNYMSWMDAADIENKQGIISVHESADIMHRLNLKAVEAPYKIVIIWLPEKMNHPAANKLLKILEEPPEKTLFFLVSENYEELLSTVVSRTQLVKVSRISESDMLTELTTNHGVDKSTARHLHHKSNGSFSEALQLLDRAEERTVFQQDFILWMRACYQLNVKVINEFALKLNERSRDGQKEFLIDCLDNIRECLLINYANRSLVRIDGEELTTLARLAPLIHINNADEFVEEFNKATFHIDRNANFKILFSDLSFTVNRLLRMER
ncbi:MAG TPA: DNA polymerase III subunit delta' [Bacteroidia bacterium]|jgi:DNA polymerase-3 subunit delta'|nr:DNA polymerase III subunit delta' [Bacteroidota bacterium]MBP9790129.1 DNA polymerase III subunit delta' [Bacteroidia bacterium]MBK7571085.1 DNA polymerase III subunit delta' [Bacteroidota bacterium]MBP9924254.1 DNA polymerase III subunit delta' [Bacteroidia bacterium]HQV99683.1 DNA polymerase III subunit delta' [Bacteroidia bacterium]